MSVASLFAFSGHGFGDGRGDQKIRGSNLSDWGSAICSRQERQRIMVRWGEVNRDGIVVLVRLYTERLMTRRYYLGYTLVYALYMWRLLLRIRSTSFYFMTAVFSALLRYEFPLP